MKDFKSYVIGFLSCLCMFLFMGQGFLDDPEVEKKYEKMFIKQLMVEEISVWKKGERMMTIINPGDLALFDNEGTIASLDSKGLVFNDERNSEITVYGPNALFIEKSDTVTVISHKGINPYFVDK